jgi:hypothetical protein
VRNYLASCPLIGIGWSASEDYLRTAIVDTATATKRAELDAFTLVDLSWESNHSEIAAAYGKDESKSFAKVDIAMPLSTDCLFQWLQARHALNRMINLLPSEEQAPLVQLRKDLEQPACNHPLQSWADSWLPTWVRMCWRSGAMQGWDPRTGRMIGPLEIPVTPRDAHIPLTGMSIERLTWPIFF